MAASKPSNRDKQLAGLAGRRQEAREELVGGSAEIKGKSYPLKNWSPNGFCIGPTDLAPKIGDRIDIGFVIPVGGKMISFACRTGVMRYDRARQEIGGVFFNLPEGVERLIEEHFDVKAPKGYGGSLFARLRDALAGPSDEESEPTTSNTAPVVVRDIPHLEAAQKGNADSQALLGFCYLLGEGVPQDDGLAEKWLGLAAAQGHREAIRGQEILAQRRSAAKTAAER